MKSNQAHELLKRVLSDVEIYDGRVSASTSHEIKSYLEAADALKGPVHMDNATALDECRLMYNTGNRVEAVKHYRSLTGCTLREAHLAVTQ